MARRIGDFLRRFLRVNPQFREQTTSQLVAALQVGEIDLAAASLPVPKADIAGSELFPEEFLLVVPKKRPLCGRPMVKAQDLRNACEGVTPFGV